MAPLRRHPIALPAAALVCPLLALAIGGAVAAAAAASSPPPLSLSSSSSSSPKLFFGHLPRTRYPPAAQSWRATAPGAPVYAHLACGDVLAALVAANASFAPAAAAAAAAARAPANAAAAPHPPIIPAAFSWCSVGGANLCAPSWQQHNAAMPPAYCGSCFLHATLSALQDRIKGARHVGALALRASAAAFTANAANAAASNAAAPSSSPPPASQASNLQDVMLGRQAFLNCAPVHGLSKGCNGGEPLDVLHYMARHGLPDEGCVPYSATDHTRFGKKEERGKKEEEAGAGGEAARGRGGRGAAAFAAWSDAAPTAAEALRALRDGDGDDSNSGNKDERSDDEDGRYGNHAGGNRAASASGYLLRGDPKCRGPERGARQCMNCMPLPDDPTKKKKEGDDDDDDPIPAQCWAVERPIRYGVRAFGKVAAGEEGMQREILARGPVVCGIACPEKFVYGYKGGVYVDDGADKELDHDVEVVGWGEEEVAEEGEEEDGRGAASSGGGGGAFSAAGQNATAASAAANKAAKTTTTRKYWLVRNSWGTYWGELGFFKLERGANALQIEGGEDGTGDCWWAEPDLSFEEEVARGSGGGKGGRWRGSMHGIVKSGSAEERGKLERAVDGELATFS